MQTLFLIGNGFDMNLSMKTSYVDFCKVYQKTESKSEIITRLKEQIKSDVWTWSDLEYTLGKYTSQLNTQKEFDEIYDDLIEHLGNYLEVIEKNVDWTKIDTEKLLQYLKEPEEVLPSRDRIDLQAFKSGFVRVEWFVDVITFNYTMSLERLLNDKFENVVIGITPSRNQIILRNVQHIHGYTDDGMVLGINDVEQLSNEEFKKNKNILKNFIKANNNRRQGHNVDQILSKRISEANLIYIFGCSIGDTDNVWWEEIGKRLLSSENCYLIIFTKPSEEIGMRFRYRNNDWEDVIRERFMTKTKLKIDEYESFDNRVFVRSNTKMFKNILG